MNIHIHKNCKRPIYSRIYGTIKKRIITGELISGESLPSIRMLAHELNTSCATVARAYNDLLRIGLIYSIPGRGYFVSTDERIQLKSDDQEKIVYHLNEIRQVAASINLSIDELLEIFI